MPLEVKDQTQRGIDATQFFEAEVSHTRSEAFGIHRSCLLGEDSGGLTGYVDFGSEAGWACRR